MSYNSCSTFALRSLPCPAHANIKKKMQCCVFAWRVSHSIVSLRLKHTPGSICYLFCQRFYCCILPCSGRGHSPTLLSATLSIFVRDFLNLVSFSSTYAFMRCRRRYSCLSWSYVLLYDIQCHFAFVFSFLLGRTVTVCKNYAIPGDVPRCYVWFSSVGLSFPPMAMIKVITTLYLHDGICHFYSSYILCSLCVLNQVGPMPYNFDASNRSIISPPELDFFHLDWFIFFFLERQS